MLAISGEPIEMCNKPFYITENKIKLKIRRLRMSQAQDLMASMESTVLTCIDFVNPNEFGNGR